MPSRSLKKYFRILSTSFCILALPILLPPKEVQPFTRTAEGIVFEVTDGDTIKLETKEGTKLKIRFYGLDAPESPKFNRKTGQISKPGQAFGKEAGDVLASKILGKKVKVDVLDIDRYRRMVSIVWLGDRNINLEMVREGMAEAYKEYLRGPLRAQFLEAEKEAKIAKKGIWSLSKYERPSEFRKSHKVRG